MQQLTDCMFETPLRLAESLTEVNALDGMAITLQRNITGASGTNSRGNEKRKQREVT